MSNATETAKFTRADYAQLPEGFPASLLDGDFVREAAPTFGHQALVIELVLRLSDLAPRRVLASPVDVVIDNWNVLQPDVLVFGDHVAAARDADPEEVPVLVVEVLSPSTASRDREAKTAHYVRAGVAEVWLIDPEAGAIDVVTADGLTHHESDDTAVSAAVPGFRLRWSDLAA